MTETAEVFFGAQATYQTKEDASIGDAPDFKMPCYDLVNRPAGVDCDEGRWWGNGRHLWHNRLISLFMAWGSGEDAHPDLP